MHIIFVLKPIFTYAGEMMMSVTWNDFKGPVRRRLTEACDYLRAHAGATLFIPPGEYLLEDARAQEVRRAVMAGEYGANPEPVMFNPEFIYSRGFDLDGCRDVTISAYGVTLLVDGFMEPVSLRNCRNVSLCGLTIDHTRKPFSKGTIADGGDGYFIVRYDEAYPFSIQAASPRIMAYSPTTKRYEDISIREDGGEELAPFTVRYPGEFKPEMIGWEVYLIHSLHSRPAVLISHAQNISLTDVTIHSQPGMGIVGFKSSDIRINRLAIVPSQGVRVSTNTDATHFACCSGELSVTNSRFDGQGDDAINVHNYYYTMRTPQECACTLSVDAPSFTHSQEPDIPVEGQRLGLVNRRTLEMLREYTVVKSSRTYPTAVELDSPVPKDCGEYLLANISQQPRLRFCSNTVYNHFARAVLVKTSHTLIENNLFVDGMGAAVQVAAEAGWHEGVAADDVTIRNNTFIHCGYEWQVNAVCVNIDAEETAQTPLHHGIRIEGNHIVGDGKAKLAIQVEQSQDVHIMNNCIEGEFDQAIQTEHCEDVALKDNRVNS